MRQIKPRRKNCTKCGEPKELSAYYTNSRAKDGRTSACITCLRAEMDAYHQRCRALVFGHYGTSCACCGVTGKLALDHVNGNGDEHRELLGLRGPAFYAYLVSRDFPAECEPDAEFALQTLCTSCNRSKGPGDHCQKHCTEHEHSVQAKTLGDLAEEKARRDSRIFELRAQGLTQAQIAREVGCAQPTVGRVLRAAA
jgi:hypothetical protein